MTGCQFWTNCPGKIKGRPDTDSLRYARSYEAKRLLERLPIRCLA